MIVAAITPHSRTQPMTHAELARASNEDLHKYIIKLSEVDQYSNITFLVHQTIASLDQSSYSSRSSFVIIASCAGGVAGAATGGAIGVVVSEGSAAVRGSIGAIKRVILSREASALVTKYALVTGLAGCILGIRHGLKQSSPIIEELRGLSSQENILDIVTKLTAEFKRQFANELDREGIDLPTCPISQSIVTTPLQGPCHHVYELASIVDHFFMSCMENVPFECPICKEVFQDISVLSVPPLGQYNLGKAKEIAESVISSMKQQSEDMGLVSFFKMAYSLKSLSDEEKSRLNKTVEAKAMNIFADAVHLASGFDDNKMTLIIQNILDLYAAGKIKSSAYAPSLCAPTVWRGQLTGAW